MVGLTDSFLDRRLTLILDDEMTQVPDDPYQIASDLATQLEEARRRVSDLERQLVYAVDRLCGGLALGVRKQQPGLNIGLDKGCCKIGYRSKHLTMRPDLSKKVWVVDSADPRFARRFMHGHRPTTALASDLMPLANAIVNFFTGHYLTLGESISGRGLLMVDNRQISLGDLAKLVRRFDDLLVEGA